MLRKAKGGAIVIRLAVWLLFKVDTDSYNALNPKQMQNVKQQGRLGKVIMRIKESRQAPEMDNMPMIQRCEPKSKGQVPVLFLQLKRPT